MQEERLIQRTRPIEKILRPFEYFAQLESSSGLLLLACAIAAMAWANSPWQAQYFDLWEETLTIGVGDYALSKSLHHWINDGLMVLFFFVVGLEIKREVLVGELSSLRKSAVPIAGAIGGMVVPALFYVAVNWGGEGLRGWGIPMATDIAFALGILALVGKGVPFGLKVFLTALAIVDDLGAVLVIAFFYTDDLSWASLGFGALVVVLLVLANRSGIRRPSAYLVLGVALWICVLKSGVHATVAGVVLAFTIPSRAFIDVRQFVSKGRSILEGFEGSDGEKRGPHLYDEKRQSAVHALHKVIKKVETPLQSFEHALLPWVSFLILPLFAFANAGVMVGSDLTASLGNPVTLGIILGLVAGKPIGILLASWLCVKSGFGSLAEGVGWKQMAGVGFLAGVGFTMSLFIAALAFPGTEFSDAAKIGVLLASTVAGIAGFLLVRMGTRPARV